MAEDLDAAVAWATIRSYHRFAQALRPAQQPCLAAPVAVALGTFEVRRLQSGVAVWQVPGRVAQQSREAVTGIIGWIALGLIAGVRRSQRFRSAFGSTVS